MIELCSSGDLGYVPHTGHFHPNKPPGTSFLALPAYLSSTSIERALGMNPDAWWTLTLNAWLTTICSVGLISALGCVLFFRLARDFAGGAILPAARPRSPSLSAPRSFPSRTLLFDHALTASLLLAALLLHSGGKSAGAFVLAGVVRRARGGHELRRRRRRGFARALRAALARPIAGPARLGLAARALFVAGVLPFAVPPRLVSLGQFRLTLRLANDFQNPVFKDPAGSLGMFACRAYVGGLITVSPYRGIFLLCPC